MDKQPDPIDVAAGRHVRGLRARAGMSQMELADAIGLTFQQVQKYERGTNRMSLSKFVRICQALGTPPADFFEEAGLNLAPEEVLAVDPEVQDIAVQMERLKGRDAEQFAAVSKIVRGLVSSSPRRQADSDPAGNEQAHTETAPSAPDESERPREPGSTTKPLRSTQRSAQRLIEKQDGRTMRAIRRGVARGEDPVAMAARLRIDYARLTCLIDALEKVGS